MFVFLFEGRCRCEHHTSGEMCERCEPGYYGYALAGTPDDCEICPCPDNGECVELLDGEIACINCREGHTGGESWRNVFFFKIIDCQIEIIF